MKYFYQLILTGSIFILLPACQTSEHELNQAGTNANLSEVITYSPEETIIIYDQRSNGQGISLVPVNLNTPSDNINADVVRTFLENNHILNSKNKVSLLRIEDFSDVTTFYLSSIEGLGKPENIQLFKKALELTIMRQLNNDDFNIIYGQTAQL